MNIQQIQYVSTIAHFKSMNQAAKHLFISQPNLSQAIKDLEEELGTSLFERSHKGVSLTEDGIEFLQMSRNILHELEHLQEYFNAKNNSNQLYFQVSSQHYSFVLDAFLKFIDKYKNSSYIFNVKETRTLTTIEDVFNRSSAIGVISITNNNNNIINQILEKKNLCFNPLFKINPHVFLSINHPLANKYQIYKDELCGYPIILFEQNGENDYAEDFIINDNAKQKIYAYDRGTMLNLISNTNAYNIGTGYIIPNIVPSNVISVPLADMDEEMCVGWIHLKGKKPSSITLEFLDLINESILVHSPKENVIL